MMDNVPFVSGVPGAFCLAIVPVLRFVTVPTGWSENCMMVSFLQDVATHKRAAKMENVAVLIVFINFVCFGFFKIW